MPRMQHRSFTSRRREVFAWAMYDWANSAYSTLLITVVLYYIQKIVAPDKLGLTLFPLCIGAIMLLAAILSPIVGAVADANRSKRRWLAGTVLGGSLSAAVMAIAPPGQTWLVLAAFVAMGVCFELSLVPYNGFLPEITDERSINRISALGFAMGYIGGAVPLGLAWAIVRLGASWGLSDAAQHRAGILLLGLWWAVFSLPAILVLRDRGLKPDRRELLPRAARLALAEVGRTLANVRSYPALALFLLAFLFYNDGIQTVITQSNAVAKDVGFSLNELFALVLLIQLIALPCSLLVGRLSDRWGQKPVLLSCLAVWAALVVAVPFVHNKGEVWAMGAVLAMVLGGTQSVSRAIMGLLTPPDRAAEFFGFFNVSGKAASVLGPIQFAAVAHYTGNVRWAAVSLLVFFILGTVLLARVRVGTPSRQSSEQGA
jgi:MFS transporter, UMF1 family